MTPPRAQRPAARILLTDALGRVLLFRFDPDDRPPFWVTPGGALDPGETYEAAARRELQEETGIVADPGAQVHRKIAEFITIEGIPVVADERFFRVAIDDHGDHLIDVAGHTALERQVMRSWRWFDHTALAELDEAYFPEDLAEMLGW
ncbi:NUDIX hydrolase [Novosphingobium aquimarinum]|uniref:NUDIX hydrolase n=1 Tax=Novosphingobium aquimarinum TaxID=2682494 RepID=UPI0012ECA459|nr:NUDIX domain-containing protein [Novosphingobium aquimarinum]